MTDYNDSAQIHALVAEQAQIQAALDLLEDEGTVVQVTIGPTEQSQAPSVMRVTVNTPDAPQAMISGVRAGLKQRYNAINKELRDLGVENVPPDHTGGPSE